MSKRKGNASTDPLTGNMTLTGAEPPFVNGDVVESSTSADFASDGSVRRALNYIAEEMAIDEEAGAVLAQALSLAIENKFSLRRTAAALHRTIERRRPVLAHNRASRLTHDPPQVVDARRLEAIRQIEHLLARLDEAYDLLLSKHADPTAEDREVDLVDRLYATIGGRTNIRPESVDADRRTLIINTISTVAGMRLPETVHELTRDGVLNAELVARFLPSLDDVSGATWVVELVRGRYPEIGRRLAEEAESGGIIPKALTQWKSQTPGNRRWGPLVSLLDAVDLWQETRTSTASTKDSDSDLRAQENNLRTTYATATGRLPTLDTPENRWLIWTRLCEFAVATGLGRPTPEQFEHARTRVVLRERQRSAP